jgi:antitoxin ParD1/3/4
MPRVLDFVGILHGGAGVPTRNVVLTEHHEKVISDLVASGRYQNASEVLREGLRLIEERDARKAAKLKILQEAARAGFADFDAGRFVEVEDDAVDEVIRDLGRQARARGLGTQS